MRRLLPTATALLLVMLFLQHDAGAQTAPDTLLQGALVASTTAAQDEIVLYDTATQALRRLNFGVGWHQFWGFSPDGCRLLFTLSAGIAPSRVYSARLDGTDLREMVTFTEVSADLWGAWEPTWQPVAEADGSSRIAFTLYRDEEQPDGTVERIYRTAWIPGDVLTAPHTPVYYSVTGDEHTPTWSPDGRWLAYVSYTERVPGESTFATAAPTPTPADGAAVPLTPLLREADLWVVSADGGTKYPLTRFDTGSVSMPRWSPDSALVGFIFSPSASNDTFWMIANADGAIPTQLSNQWALILDLTWLPDGTALLASVRDFRNTAQNLLWNITLLGNADNDATPYFSDPALGWADYARFSPDGRWLALRSAYSFVLVDTTQQTWFTLEDAAGNAPLFWSPAAFAGELACAR